MHSFADAAPKLPQITPTALSASAIEERWNRRSTILGETNDHLLVHPHNGLSDTGRNIAFVLRDRETFGAQAVTSWSRFQRFRPQMPTDFKEDDVIMSTDESRSSLGDRSPSTVLESPLQRATLTTSRMRLDTTVPLADSAANNHSNMGEEGEGNASSPVQTAVSSPLHRRVTYPLNVTREIRTFSEYAAVTHYHSAFLTHLGGDDVLDTEGHLPASSRAVSTISIAFCPDGSTMASTHGDHTVKITCCSTGRLLRSLEGHPRTPWTVKYHPSDPHRLASGCLGHQVRLWNWPAKLCLQMIRLEFAIISLSFHPSGSLLAIANGTRLHFWGIPEQDAVSDGTPGENSPPLAAGSSHSRAPLLTELDQRHMLRCVHFPPNGTTLILGGVNPTADDPRRLAMTFYLRLWDFDITQVLGGGTKEEASGGWSFPPMPSAQQPIYNVCQSKFSYSSPFIYRHTHTSFSREPLFPERCCIMMVVSIWMPRGKFFVSVRSTSYQKVFTMPWTCCIKSNCHISSNSSSRRKKYNKVYCPKRLLRNSPRLDSHCHPIFRHKAARHPFATAWTLLHCHPIHWDHRQHHLSVHQRRKVVDQVALSSPERRLQSAIPNQDFAHCLLRRPQAVASWRGAFYARPAIRASMPLPPPFAAALLDWSCDHRIHSRSCTHPWTPTTRAVTSRTWSPSVSIPLHCRKSRPAVPPVAPWLVATARAWVNCWKPVRWMRPRLPPSRASSFRRRPISVSLAMACASR
jgi:WD domain, G-beta repeat